MKTLLVATNNPGKWQEMRGLLVGLPLTLQAPSDLGLTLGVDELGGDYAANARLKACLKLLGRLDNALMRPPVGPLPAEEIAALEAALAAAGLLPAPARRGRPTGPRLPTPSGALP